MKPYFFASIHFLGPRSLIFANRHRIQAYMNPSYSTNKIYLDMKKGMGVSFRPESIFMKLLPRGGNSPLEAFLYCFVGHFVFNFL